MQRSGIFLPNDYNNGITSSTGAEDISYQENPQPNLPLPFLEGKLKEDGGGFRALSEGS